MATRDTIVIGASAGGVEALCTLVAALPANLPAVFIVLHLGADSPSLWPGILGRHSVLPVGHSKSGERIRMGRIYVARPDHHLLIEGHKNEELQAANEELMLTQDELQATNEEFEATNEELQATNEELETNNEELQATNEELQTTNDELTARTVELQEVMKQHHIEQLQLSQLLERFPTT